MTIRDISKVKSLETAVRIMNTSEYIYADYRAGEIIEKQFRDLEVISISVLNNVLVILVRDKEEDSESAELLGKYLI